MNKVIEVVIFKANANTTDDQLQSAALAITPMLEKMDGYLSREFAKSEDGSYIDIVYWQDLVSAKSAAETVMSIPQCKAFFDLIDQTQMQFMHFSKIA